MAMSEPTVRDDPFTRQILAIGSSLTNPVIASAVVPAARPPTTPDRPDSVPWGALLSQPSLLRMPLYLPESPDLGRRFLLKTCRKDRNGPFSFRH